MSSLHYLLTDTYVMVLRVIALNHHNERIWYISSSTSSAHNHDSPVFARVF